LQVDDMKHLFAALLLLVPLSAQGQIGPGASVPVTAAGTSAATAGAIQGVTGGVPVPVSGTFSATLSGFAPSGNYTSPMAVTAVSSEIGIPSGSPSVILVSNVGVDPAYVNLGTTSGVTATTADVPIGPGAAVALTVGSNTYIAAITAGSDTTTLNIAGGSGLFSGIAGATGSALPTGASTSANQAAIQGTTAGGTAPTKDNVVGATYNSTLPTLTTGQSASLQSDSLGRLLITSTQTGAGAANAGSPRFTVAEDSNTVAGSSSLPTGSNTIGAVTGPSAAALATAVLQTTGNTALSTINTTLGTPMQATGGTVDIAPSASSAIGITPIVSTSAEGGHVLKASGGNLYAVYVTTGATGGYLMVFNSATVPADGAVTPLECVNVPANQTIGISYGSGPPAVYSTGISAAFSTTGCFTKTASATAFFHGSVQ
jgi:hypothetical protein